MNDVLVIIKTICMLGILGGIGFWAGRTGYLPEQSGVILSRIVIKLTAPILIATTLASRSFSRTMLETGILIYLCGLIFILLAFLVSLGICRWMNISGATGNVLKMQAMFGNVIFLAFPLLESVFGDEGVVYAVFYNLANDTILWTLGIYLVNRHKTRKWKENIKHLINGNTVAFGIGILCVLLGLQSYVGTHPGVRSVYTFLYETLYPLGHTTIYLSMLFIGLILSQTKLGGREDMKRLFPNMVLSLSKLLFVPLVAFGIFLTAASYLPSTVKAIVLLQLAMPCATIVPALASQYDSDYRFATESVFISTVLGVFTLPLMVWLTHYF